MKSRPRSTSSSAFRAPLCAVAQACVLALLVNGNAWSQANAVNTAAGQFIAKSGNASLVSGLPNGQTVIRLDNTKSILEWARLNVAQGNSLQFIQPNQQSVVLNRVTGGDVTRIDGSLLSNGHVWLLNPSGVLFGANSSVNVQSLLATTRAISDADFLTNKLHFAGGGAGQVSNAGVIAVGEGGYVVLSAQSVENIGSIQAQLGQVHLASGKAFVIDLNGDKLLRFDVTQALSSSDATESLVKNTGNILADGGRVQMTARAANGLVGQVVNTGGLLQANSVRSVNGEIVLDAGLGGKTTVGGTLSAQGNDANSKGGNITALGDNIQIPSGARINASGQAGGGNVLIGGDWQGSGSLQQATTVEMQQGAEIKANATQNGDGGKVVLWSDVKTDDGQTSIAGNIEARGGLWGGNGGKVETSGRDLKIAKTTSVNAGSANGSAGKWLLDPVNVVIDSTSATTITDSLTSSDVAVTASGASASISVNAPLTWGVHILSLESGGNVYINDIVTAKGPFAGLMVKTGYSTPGVNGGTYDATKSLLFGLSSSGFKGRINIQDASGVARSGFGFVLNGSSYSLINDVTSLQNNMAAGLSGNYVLTGDIDASATAGWNAGAGFVPIGDSVTKFTGRFNGLGHTISNLTINRSGTDYVGLFGYSTGSIQSLGLNNISVAGRANVGALAGVNVGGKIANVFVLNTPSQVVSGTDTVGGLIGLNASSAQVSNSWVATSVSGTNAVGGFVGYNQASSITASYYSVAGLANPDATTVSLLPAAGFPATLGGFVGTNQSATISNSYANANVVGKILTPGQTGGAIVGGFVGYNFSSGSIADSYAAGKLVTDFNVPGQPRLTGSFVGQNSAIISNAFTTATFNGGDPSFGFSDVVPGSAYISNSYAPSVADKYKTSSYSFDAINNNAYSVDNTGATSGNLLGSANWVIYGGHTAPLLTTFLTPLNVAIASTAKVYDGTVNYTPTVSYTTSSGKPIDVDQTKLTLTTSLNSKNVGSRALAVDAWSTQEGYLVDVSAPSAIQVTPAVLSVGVTGVNKAYDGNTTATVNTTDNRIGNDVLNISSTANFVDPLVATNKAVNVTGISISGTDAVNYTLASTTASTTATITASQTTAAVQTAVSAALPSAASASVFSSSVVSPTVASSTTSAVATRTTTTNASTSSSSQTVSSNSTTATTTNQSASSSSASTDESSNTTLTVQNATSTTTAATSTVTAAPTTTATISVNTQSVARTTAVAATQATTVAQGSTVTTGVANSNTNNQVQIVSLNTTSSAAAPPVGAQTIAPVQTPKSAEDQADPVLAAVNSFKPAAPASTNNRAPARGRDAPVVVPLVQGILVMETSPPKAATQAVDEQRLSASGDRSRW